MQNKQTIFSNKIFKDTYVFILCLLISYALSILYMRLPEFDFYSYHYYNGWAFWHNRLNIDLMPCAFRTYFNPLLDAFNYFLLERLNNHPLLFVILSGFKYGILMFIAYKLYDFFWSKFGESNIYNNIFCFITAAATPIMIYCLSFEMVDMHIAILLLLGLYIYLKNVFGFGIKRRLVHIFISAFIVGIAFGLKYTAISIAFSLFISTLFFYKKIEHPIKTLLCILTGILCGFLITDGFWIILIYERFGNPLFPYFNNIFHSPMADVNSMVTTEFHHLVPHNIIDWLFSPLKNSARNPFVGFESRHFDLKIVLGFVSILASLFFIKKKSFKESLFKTEEIFNIYIYLLIFSALTFYTNSLIFANVRYIIPIFIIIPIIVCVIIKYIVKNEFYNHCLTIVLLLVISTIYVPTGIQIDWLHPDKVISVNDMKFEDNSTIICGTITACFLAPYQNPNVKYVGYGIDEEFANKSYYSSYKRLKNLIFVNKYLKDVQKNVLSTEENVYFVYAARMFGKDMYDLDLYEEYLSKDLGKKVDLTKCRNLRYFVYDILRANSDVYVCKIK